MITQQHNRAGRGGNACSPRPRRHARLWVLLGALAVPWPALGTPTPHGGDCLYLQYVDTSKICKGGLTSRNISTCAMTQIGDGQGPGQCPGEHQDEGGSFSGRLGNDRLLYRFSMPVPREDWGTGDYSATSKVLMADGDGMRFYVVFRRMSKDCQTTHQTLGIAGPFTRPDRKSTVEFVEAKIYDVASKRASTTDRLVIDYYASGAGFYTFGVTWGHAEHVFTPWLACPTVTPQPATSASTEVPTRTEIRTPTPTPTATVGVSPTRTPAIDCNALCEQWWPTGRGDDAPTPGDGWCLRWSAECRCARYAACQ